MTALYILHWRWYFEGSVVDGASAYALDIGEATRQVREWRLDDAAKGQPADSWMVPL